MQTGIRLWASHLVTNAFVGALVGGGAAFFIPLLSHTRGALIGAFLFAAAGVFRDMSSNPTATVIPEQPAGVGLGVADELLKFAELRSKGVITEEEFQARKKRLLES